MSFVVEVYELLLPKANSEIDVKDFLKLNPEILGQSARFVEEEFSLARGRIDMVFYSKDEVLFVEVKRERYQIKNVVEKYQNQLIKYYRSILGLALLFGKGRDSFRLILVVGFNELDKERRYDVDLKVGRLYKSFSRPKRFLELSHEISGLQREVGLLEQEKEYLETDLKNLKEKIVELSEKERSDFVKYGDRLLYVLPDFFYAEKFGSGKCFVCGVRSDIVLQISGNRLYGLCKEHFKLLSSVPPFKK